MKSKYFKNTRLVLQQALKMYGVDSSIRAYLLNEVNALKKDQNEYFIPTPQRSNFSTYGTIGIIAFGTIAVVGTILYLNGYFSSGSSVTVVPINPNIIQEGHRIIDVTSPQSLADLSQQASATDSVSGFTGNLWPSSMENFTTYHALSANSTTAAASTSKLESFSQTEEGFAEIAKESTFSLSSWWTSLLQSSNNSSPALPTCSTVQEVAEKLVSSTNLVTAPSLTASTVVEISNHPAESVSLPLKIGNWLKEAGLPLVLASAAFGSLCCLIKKKLRENKCAASLKQTDDQTTQTLRGTKNSQNRKSLSTPMVSPVMR